MSDRYGKRVLAEVRELLGEHHEPHALPVKRVTASGLVLEASRDEKIAASAVLNRHGKKKVSTRRRW